MFPVRQVSQLHPLVAVADPRERSVVHLVEAEEMLACGLDAWLSGHSHLAQKDQRPNSRSILWPITSGVRGPVALACLGAGAKDLSDGLVG